MGLLPQPLLLLHADPAVRARVQRAVPPLLHLVEVPDWKALRAAVSTAPPGSVALVDPSHGLRGGSLSAELSRLLRDYPRLRVLALVPDAPGRRADFLTLGAWGVADVLVAGSDERAPILRKRLGVQRADHFAPVLRLVKAPWLTGQGWALVEGATEVAAGRAGAEEWARLWGVSSRALLRLCHAEALPPPRRLLAWMRVLLAADLLESPGHSVATVAAACGYAADMPLRRAIRRLTGIEAPMLIEAGNALATAATRFVAELEVLRDSPGGRPYHSDLQPLTRRRSGGNT